MKRQPIEWEDTFENHMSAQGLNLEYVMNSYNLIKKKTTLFLKWVKDLKRHFSKEDLQMTNNQHNIEEEQSWNTSALRQLPCLGAGYITVFFP